VADGNLQILDVTDPFNPVFTGSCDSDGQVHNVFVSDSYAYATTDNLHILDASDPFIPVSVGSYEVPGNAGDVFVSGDYAYVAHGDSLQILDVSDPSNPIYAGAYEAERNIIAFFISGDYAYIVWSIIHLGDGGLEIIDISDPVDPILLGIYECNRRPQDVFVSGNYAYIPQEYGSFASLLIIDITDPTEPTRVEDYGIWGSAAGRVYVEGSYAYIAYASFIIIDISEPAQPIFLGAFDNPGYTHDVFVSGHYAYLADGNLQIVDVSDPENPLIAASYDTPGEAHGVFVADDYTYVADRSSLMILRFYPETGIEEVISLPDQFSLGQNYPNPFNASTIIEYDLPSASNVIIDIYDLLGRRIETLIQGEHPAGYHQVVWDAADHSSGLYFYRIQAGDYAETRKMVLLK
jgi:hypothetical protein